MLESLALEELHFWRIKIDYYHYTNRADSPAVKEMTVFILRGTIINRAWAWFINAGRQTRKLSSFSLGN